MSPPCSPKSFESSGPTRCPDEGRQVHDSTSEQETTMKSHRTGNGIVSRWRRRRAESRKQDPTHRSDLEPQHDQPWIPRSGLADRLRRSPRE